MGSGGAGSTVEELDFCRGKARLAVYKIVIRCPISLEPKPLKTHTSQNILLFWFLSFCLQFLALKIIESFQSLEIKNLSNKVCPPEAKVDIIQ